MQGNLSVFGWIAAIVFLGMILVIAGATWLKHRKSRSWRSARGRVVSARVESLTLRGTRDIPKTGNYARIEYTYEVGGKRYTGTRVGLTEPNPDFEVSEALARYPEGREVEVFYDPKDPAKAVLERTLPEGVGKGFLVLILFFGGIAVSIYLYFTRGVDWLAEHLPDGNDATLVSILLFVGIIAVLVALAMIRRGLDTARWPRVSGEIVSAEVVSFKKRSLSRSGQTGSMTTLYAPHITYRYRVGDVEYKGSRIHMGAEISYGSEEMASKIVDRYRIGSPVTVRFDPANPAESTLETRAKGAWILFMIGIALLALAWLAARAGAG